jgi:hypothetical protein
MKKLILAAAHGLVGLAAPAVILPQQPARINRGRRMTCDVAFKFRMGAGFPGDINRTHPFNVVGGLPNVTSPPTFYGQPCIRESDGTWRAFTAADGALINIDGVTVRPYPAQPSDASNYGAVGIGAAALQTGQVIDICIMGFIMVKVNGANNPQGQTHIWTAASAGAHVLGGFEAAATGGSTADITWPKTRYFSAPDADGVAELAFNI